MRQVHNDARQKTGFSRAHQKTHDIKLPRGVNERHEYGHHAPGNHDASDPLASAPSFDNQRAWDFQQEVTKKEDPGAKSDHALAESQVMWHLKRGSSNVHAIKKSDHVEQEQKRQKTPRDALASAPAYIGRQRRRGVARSGAGMTFARCAGGILQYSSA